MISVSGGLPRALYFYGLNKCTCRAYEKQACTSECAAWYPAVLFPGRQLNNAKPSYAAPHFVASCRASSSGADSQGEGECGWQELVAIVLRPGRRVVEFSCMHRVMRLGRTPDSNDGVYRLLQQVMRGICTAVYMDWAVRW